MSPAEPYLITGATLVNEGLQWQADVRVRQGRIEAIAPSLPHQGETIVTAEGLHLLPGVIDDQVHFREPGLTHKGSLGSESRAAVAGGTTTYLEMPNTQPTTTDAGAWQWKMARAAATSAANYAFYMGATPDNLDELLQADPTQVPGVKVFMGSSTGSLLVDDPHALERIFGQVPLLIATHCEDEATIRANLAAFSQRYPRGIPPECHPQIRSAEGCYRSSSLAVQLARQHGTRLHVLHISTAQELALFAPGPVAGKRITAEACLHHLWFTDADYAALGHLLKWNPAVKTAADRQAVRQAVTEGRIDVLATDHAPHTLAEKQQDYLKAPSGGPLIEFALLGWLTLAAQGVFTLPQVVEKSSHAVAECFGITDRGYLREGYWADLVLVDLQGHTVVGPGTIRSQCGWSPLQGQRLQGSIHSTWVSGRLAYHQGQVLPGTGQPVRFRG